MLREILTTLMQEHAALSSQIIKAVRRTKYLLNVNPTGHIVLRHKKTMSYIFEMDRYKTDLIAKHLTFIDFQDITRRYLT
jgi:hypothetical protein